jgi:hypothetical protein
MQTLPNDPVRMKSRASLCFCGDARTSAKRWQVEPLSATNRVVFVGPFFSSLASLCASPALQRRSPRRNAGECACPRTSHSALLHSRTYTFGDLFRLFLSRCPCLFFSFSPDLLSLVMMRELQQAQSRIVGGLCLLRLPCQRQDPMCFVVSPQLVTYATTALKAEVASIVFDAPPIHKARPTPLATQARDRMAQCRCAGFPATDAQIQEV